MDPIQWMNIVISVAGAALILIGIFTAVTLDRGGSDPGSRIISGTVLVFGGAGCVFLHRQIANALAYAIGVFTGKPVKHSKPAPPAPVHHDAPSGHAVDNSLLIMIVLIIAGVLVVTFAGIAAFVIGKKVWNARHDHRERVQAERATAAALRHRWDRAEQSYRELQEVITGADHDLDTLLSAPLLADGTHTPTRKAWEALETAQSRQEAGFRGDAEATERLEHAVIELRIAWRTAQSSAKALGVRNMTREEQRAVRTARKLLANAADPSTPPTLRANYYSKARDTLDQLTSLAHIATRVTEAIETRNRPVLEAKGS